MERKNIIKTGIFVVITIALFIWGIGFIKNKNVFSSDDFFYGKYENIKGLTTSSFVILNGLQVGEVTKISFNDNYSVIVKIQIDDGVKLPENSVIKIVSSDIMGTKAIELLRAEDKGKYHKSGDTLLTSIEDDLKEQVNKEMLPLKLKTESMISSIDSVLMVVQGIFNDEAQTDLQKSLRNIRLTLSNLAGTTKTLDNLMSSEKSRIAQILSNAESITSNLKNNNKEIAQILSNLSKVSDTIANSKIKGVISEAHRALGDFNKILAQVNKGEGTLGMLIHNDSLYVNLANAAKSLDELLIDVKKNPKRYVHFSAF